MKHQQGIKLVPGNSVPNSPWGVAGIGIVHPKCADWQGIWLGGTLVRRETLLVFFFTKKMGLVSENQALWRYRVIYHSYTVVGLAMIRCFIFSQWSPPWTAKSSGFQHQGASLEISQSCRFTWYLGSGEVYSWRTLVWRMWDFGCGVSGASHCGLPAATSCTVRGGRRAWRIRDAKKRPLRSGSSTGDCGITCPGGWELLVAGCLLQIFHPPRTSIPIWSHSRNRSSWKVENSGCHTAKEILHQLGTSGNINTVKMGW